LILLPDYISISASSCLYIGLKSITLLWLEVEFVLVSMVIDVSSNIGVSAKTLHGSWSL
jgi:hypothetical protein